MERPSGAAPPRQPGGSIEGGDANGQLLAVRVEASGDGASVITLAGELDLSTIPRIESQLLALVRSNGGLVVDLTRLNFIDSSGIGLLIKAFREVDGGGGLHTVVAPGSQVERVFQIAGIDRALPLFAERARALDALNGAARD